MLLGVSPDYLYFQKGKITRVDSLHHPYFLAFQNSLTETKSVKKKLQELWDKNRDMTPWSYITEFGDITEYQSFWHRSKKIQAFPVFVNQSFRVPEVSDDLFFHHNVFTAEHDIPYQQRVLVDIAAKNDSWICDTKGRKNTISMLVYDIEMRDFIPGKIDTPIDIIGFAQSQVSFRSFKDLSTETFDFDLDPVPHVVDEDDIIQLVSRNKDEELDHLIQFCRTIPSYDVISGHNILGFDNRQIYGRVKKLLQEQQSSLSKNQLEPLNDFLQKYTRIDTSFHFGVGSDVVQLYPSSFDTYLAARKFYPFLDSHSLKAVAPFLGFGIKDRLILTPEEINLDDTTLKYNRQDIIEQMGVSLQLIQLALPLSFTTGMSFETLLSAGAVNMWDHMALIRAVYSRKMMPATCRVNTIAKTLTRDFHSASSQEDIIKQAKNNREQLSKEFVRVVKYGPEMPDWMLYPYVIYNDKAKDTDDQSGYHMPGGMTIKPDTDAHSHFVPWYKVVVADVGAMYPTILKALNIGADTVQLCKKDKQPDMWIWMKKLPDQFFDHVDVSWKHVTAEDDSFADKGYWIGITIQKETGVVNAAMTGIMGMIAKIKKELKEVKQTGDAEEIKRLKMMYQSVKGARNAGSVDYNQRIILITPSGEYDPKKIGEFVDEKINVHGSRIETINGAQFEIADVTEPWHALSVRADGKTELKKVTKAVRHKYDGKLIKITTKSGSTVVTPNHSIFTVKNNRLSMIDAGALYEDIPIVHAINNYGKSSFQPFRSEKKEKLIDCFAIPPQQLEFVDSSSEYVYDISVEKNENFIDVDGGIVLHNTHGILAAPNVSGRQFNLWGACSITTKGQVILDDILQMLQKKGIRVTYADTDGLYLGCSRSLSNLPDFAKALGLKLAKTNDVDWLTSPDEAIKAIKECNKKWQQELNYKEFELEPEYHDVMIFVKHKNYLIFDEKNGTVEMATKGNNFKGSDKANIARKALKEIMVNVLRDVSQWSDEDEARSLVKDSIRKHTQDVVASLDFSKVDIEDLTLIQSVKPARSYKRNQDGSLSTFGKRANALEQLLGEPIKSRMKLRFVVTKKPLPGLHNPSKSGVKPIDFMYPVDKLSHKTEIDLEWYKTMIENYIQGAFGLSKIGETQQKGLDAWM